MLTKVRNPISVIVAVALLVMLIVSVFLHISLLHTAHAASSRPMRNYCSRGIGCDYQIPTNIYSSLGNCDASSTQYSWNYVQSPTFTGGKLRYTIITIVMSGTVFFRLMFL